MKRINVMLNQTNTTILSTVGNDMDVQNWLSCFKVINFVNLGDEVVIRVTDK